MTVMYISLIYTPKHHFMCPHIHYTKDTMLMNSSKTDIHKFSFKRKKYCGLIVVIMYGEVLNQNRELFDYWHYLFKKYKTFSVLIYSYINTSGHWKNEKLCGKKCKPGINWQLSNLFTSLLCHIEFLSTNIFCTDMKSYSTSRHLNICQLGNTPNGTLCTFMVLLFPP